ncbi:MAG TPA: hypothetical protein VFT96_04895 [Gemmatimonadaceae bacterium]|nr:hypothetical protein [Gemmatimonadaceae bacterium]
MSAPLPGDKPAGFLGMIVGAIAIGAILYGMTMWTAGSFEGHHKNPSAGVPAAQSNPAAVSAR